MVIALIPIAILAALTDLTASFFIRLAVVQNFLTVFSIAFVQDEYYGAAEPPVRCGESHLSGLTEPPHFIY